MIELLVIRPASMKADAKGAHTWELYSETLGVVGKRSRRTDMAGNEEADQS